MARDGMTMMLVTHETGFARRVANRVVFMHEGKIWEEGLAAATLARPRTSELETFLSAVRLRACTHKSSLLSAACPT